MQATRQYWHFNVERQLGAKELPVSDEQLLLEYRRTGDRHLFAQLVYRYERELYAYLRRYLGSTDLAEDAFQTTFMQVHLKCDQFHADRKFRPWLYTIATHQAIDTRRRNRRHQAVSLDNGEGYGDEEAGRLVQVLESGETDPSDVAAGGERDRWIRQSVEQLSEPMRAVIHLVYFQGLKYREAAEVLRIPVGTVKSRLHEAIASLTEVWKDAHQVREP